MSRYIRAHVSGGTFFFTVVLRDRRQRLLVQHVAELRDAVRHVRRRLPFTIDAMVVLPDHLHAIWTLPGDDTDFSTRWRLIKTQFTKTVPLVGEISPSRQKKAERSIWQRRFWEHTIRDDIDFQLHVDYIHYNPVKHGHAERAAAWPWSSINRYVARGTYSPDWAADTAVRNLAIE